MSSRKRSQAFAAAKDKSTKTIIKQNAVSSPLLKLPQELRDMIWAYLLGDQLIHLKHAPIRRKERYGYTRRTIGRRHDYLKDDVRFGYILCKANVTENEAYALSRSTDNEKSVDSKETDKRSFSKRHTDCYSCLSEGFDKLYSVLGTYKTPTGRPKDLDGLQRNRLPLDVLRVCRQVYVEANPIFWRTTTWPFANPRAFYRFMHGRNSVQKRLMNRLHLDFYNLVTRAVVDDWHKLITSKANKSMFQKFKALEVLHLDVRGWRVRVAR